MSPLLLALIVAAFLLGGALQRIAGMGTGIVAGPVLALALGPVVGVLLTNVAAIATALVLTVSMRGAVDWRRVARILPPATVGVLAGVAIIHRLHSAWLEVLIGVALIAGLALSSIKPRAVAAAPGPIDVVAGGVGGVMNALVGMAGPILVMDAKITGWDHARFAASLQPTFLVVNVASVLAKVIPGLPAGAELPPAWLVPVVLAAVLAGAFLGQLLAPKVGARGGRALAVVVASAGSVALAAKGVAALT